MDVTVAFGKTGLTLRLPAGPEYEIVPTQSAPAVGELAQAIGAALDAPIGGEPLLSLARGARSAAISICDITRPAPNPVTLPPVLERLHRAGIAAENIHLCIATGLHRVATEDELRQILGPEIVGRYPIVNHDAKDLEAHRAIGTTRRGTPVAVDRTFLAADLHLSLGLIEQHFMLGFSGGRKMIAPGLASETTIKAIHAPGFMRESLAIEGSIDENPLHAELLEIAGMARHDFLLDVTLTQDRQVSGVFAGDPGLAHAAGVHFLRETSTSYVPREVDAVITSAAGYPLDLTFYQTIKGVSSARRICRPGGRILAISECAEGIGSGEFRRMLLKYEGAKAFLDRIDGAPVVADQWQLEKLALIALEHPLLFFIPGADPGQMGALGEQVAATVEDALGRLVEGLAPGARVAIIPEGPYTCARVMRTKPA